MKSHHRRTVFLIIAVWLGISLAIITKEQSFLSLQTTTVASHMQSDREIWSLIHELSDDSLVAAVADYTFWDDMAEFAEGSRDVTWAQENLDPGLESFNIDALWVLRADGSLRYSVMADGDGLGTPPPFPLDRDALEALIAKPNKEYGTMHEFYWFSDIGPLSVVGADITSTDDPEHTKEPRGYYFAAIILTSEHSLSNLADIGASGEALAMTSVPPEEAPNADAPHVFWHEMWDNTGATIGAIRIERRSPTLTALLGSIRSSRWLTTALWIATGIMTSALVLALGRTQQRASALAEQMTSQLRESNALLEQRVIERTQELAQDIEHRKRFEQQLQKRTHELETMNRAMLDREQRVIELKHELEVFKKEHSS